jgi:hypothetical protein
LKRERRGAINPPPTALRRSGVDADLINYFEKKMWMR